MQPTYRLRVWRADSAQWDKLRSAEKSQDGVSDELMDALNDQAVEVHVSEVDRDPYGIMIAKDEI